MARNSIAQHLKDWEVLLVSTEANLEELAYAGDFRAQLLAAWEGARAEIARQALLRAQLQQATRDLEEHMALGKDNASRLRAGVRMQYGPKSEKLAEFGLRPRRPPEKKKEKPPEVGANPARTAAPLNEASLEGAVRV